MDTLPRWSVGIFVALGAGWAVTTYVLDVLRKPLPPPLAPEYPPGWLVGLIERLFFAIAVGFEINSTAVAMIGWITVKMLTGWNRPSLPGGPPPPPLAVAITALLGDLVSMFFALIGGLICSGKIPW